MSFQVSRVNGMSSHRKQHTTAPYETRQYILTYVHILCCYSRHQAREAEPKDYDISQNDHRDLGTATYMRIGDFTDGVCIKSMLYNTVYVQYYPSIPDSLGTK